MTILKVTFLLISNVLNVLKLHTIRLKIQARMAQLAVYGPAESEIQVQTPAREIIFLTRME